MVRRKIPTPFRRAFQGRQAMHRKTLIVGLLAMLFMMSGIHAQTPPGKTPPSAPTKPATDPAPAKPAANAVDPASIQALKDMGTYLQTLKRFGVSTDVIGESVLKDGQKLQHTARADLRVVRPEKLRARMTNAQGEREVVFDGKKITLYAPAQKYYSTAEFAGTIGNLI